MATTTDNTQELVWGLAVLALVGRGMGHTLDLLQVPAQEGRRRRRHLRRLHRRVGFARHLVGTIEPKLTQRRNGSPKQKTMTLTETTTS